MTTQATNVTLMAAMSELETTVTTRAAVDASDALNQRDTEIANLKRQLAAVNDREVRFRVYVTPTWIHFSSPVHLTLIASFVPISLDPSPSPPPPPLLSHAE